MDGIPDLPYEVTEAVMIAVAAATSEVEMDVDAALTLIESYGDEGVWFAAIAFAEMMHQAMFRNVADDGRGSFYLEVYADGERIDARMAAEDVPEGVLAMQVCSALWNRDLPLAGDLWEAAGHELKLATYNHMFGMTITMVMSSMSN